MNYTNTQETIEIMNKPYHPNSCSLFALNLIRPASYVLSCGCGSGREVSYLSENLKCNITGIDIDMSIISLNKFHNNVHYFHEDMVEEKFESKFDYIVCLWNTINHLTKEDRIKFIKTCEHNLKDNGKLIITTSTILSHWRHLLSNIKRRSNYYFKFSEIKEWFKDTSFIYNTMVWKNEVDKGMVLIVAEKVKR